MPLLRRAAPLLAAALVLAGCVSLEEAPMAARALTQNERLLLKVYAAPGPFLTEQDSKAETGAKIVPGLGLIVKDMQDQRDLKAAQELMLYLPPFDPGPEFQNSFSTQVALLGVPSRLIRPEESGLPPATWKKLNTAGDQLDWQIKYYIQQPTEAGVSRNYSTFLGLDDVVVLEVNLMYGLDSEDEQLYSPSLKAVTKLLRANTMRQLWRHENVVSEPNLKLTLYDYKTKPQDLLFAWRRLMPGLGNQIADDLRKQFQTAGVSLDPRAGLPQSPSGGTVVPLSGAGWAPAPIASSGPPAKNQPWTTAAGNPAVPAAFVPRPSTP